ncbi:hypothetical protein Tco_1399519 [Tanacetum coccineum]
MADGKDWSKLVLTNELFVYVLAKHGKVWKDDYASVDIIVDDLWKKIHNQPEIAKEVIVISLDDDALLTDEEITLMGDIPFSTTNDDSDDDDNDDDSDEEQHVKKPQAASTSASTSRGYKKIALTGRVLFLRARDAPPTSFDHYEYVRKTIKTEVKVTNCVLSLRVVNAPILDVGSSSTRMKSRKPFEMKTNEVGNAVK